METRCLVLPRPKSYRMHSLSGKHAPRLERLTCSKSWTWSRALLRVVDDHWGISHSKWTFNSWRCLLPIGHQTQKSFPWHELLVSGLSYRALFCSRLLYFEEVKTNLVNINRSSILGSRGTCFLRGESSSPRYQGIDRKESGTSWAGWKKAAGCLICHTDSSIRTCKCWAFNYLHFEDCASAGIRKGASER